jgi:hypothetical protein
MTSITRQNPYLEEIIVILDQHLLKYNGDFDLARDRLSAAENEWIDKEVLHCINDARYFISNYNAYRDEKEGFKGLYPLFDSQEILYQEYRRLEKLYGRVRALVLKARQMGSTTYNCAEFFHKTIFAEHNNAMIVGQHQKQAAFIYGMYSSALDYIPWWMKPRIKSRVTGEMIEFDEKDDIKRAVSPGLKTTIYADNANKPSGVGRGMTFNKVMMSELAFWENGSQLSKSLSPTMNTQDGFYVLESTANGRNDFWHNLWRRAEAGKVDWHPIFIPFYRREKTYSLPILKTEVFVVTDEEKEMRERVFVKESFLIKDETFKWMRNKKEEFVATDGDDTLFSQEYTSEAEESFQSSAITAFPRGVINRFAKKVRDPIWIGDVSLDLMHQRPKLHGHEVIAGEAIPYPETENRFHIWERPEARAEYALGADVALGNPGGDYSTIQVVKKGSVHQKDVQVAMWHGLINPTAFASVIAAIGWYYNEALAAVEVNSFGMMTNSVLMRNLEYENVYRYKHLDKINNFITNTTGFLSTPKSTDALMAKMSEYLLDDEIEINCKFTMDEFRDYTEEGAIGEGAHDDLVDALLIAVYCAHETEVRERQEGTRQPQKVFDSNSFQIVNRLGAIITQTNSQAEAERLSKKHIGSSIVRTAGATASIVLAGASRRVPADLQNTDHSPVHDKQGSAHRLHYEEDVPAEDITSERIAEFEAEEEAQEQDEDADAWKYV